MCFFVLAANKNPKTTQTNQLYSLPASAYIPPAPPAASLRQDAVKPRELPRREGRAARFANQKVKTYFRIRASEKWELHKSGNPYLVVCIGGLRM